MATVWDDPQFLAFDDNELDDVFEPPSLTSLEIKPQECRMSDASRNYMVSIQMLYWFDMPYVESVQFEIKNKKIAVYIYIIYKCVCVNLYIGKFNIAVFVLDVFILEDFYL